MQESAMEFESDREEGELLSDGGDEMVEDQTEPSTLVCSPLVDDDIVDPVETTDEADLTEPNEDNPNDGSTNQVDTEAETEADQNLEPFVLGTTSEPKREGDQKPEIVSVLREKISADSVVESGGSKEGSSSGTQGTQEVKKASPVGKSSTTINLQERAKLRSEATAAAG